MKVLEIATNHHDELTENMDTAEYVLVHNYLFRGLHTLYVDQYYPTMKLIRCINSWGTKDPFPCFPIKDKEKNNVLYKVWASAEEIVESSSRWSNLSEISQMTADSPFENEIVLSRVTMEEKRRSFHLKVSF